MNGLVVALGTLLLSACSTPVERQQRMMMMEEIEQRLQLPAGAAKLQEYARYYASDGDRVVGTYITLVDPENSLYDLPTGQQRWVGDRRRLPFIADGGCSVVNVLYNPATQKVERTFCNGVA